MANISSTGIGSGLDVESIISKLMTLEAAPRNRVEAATKDLNEKLSSFGKIQSALSTLRDAAKGLTDNSTFGATTATSATPTAVSVTSSDKSVAGNYSVTTSQLAKSQMVVSGVVGDLAEPLGEGTLTIEIGTWAAGQAGFTPNADATKTMSITLDANDTLADLRDKINGAGGGVVASVVTDANGSRLAMRSVASGKDAGFRIGADSNALAGFAYDPSAGVNAMTLKQAPQNAMATINGIEVESTTNTLTDVIDGLTIKLNQVTTDPVELTVATDNDSVKKSITAFADAYNALNTLVAAQTKFNGAGVDAAPLQGDSTAVGLQRQLRQLIGGTSAASTVFQRMADIGLDPQKDGTLKVNATKLDGAVAKLADLKKLFANSDDTTPGNNGFGQAIRAFADNALGIDGTLSTKQAGIKTRIERNGDRVSQLEDHESQTEKRLRAQYTALDTQMASLNGLSSYVTQMINSFSRSS